MKAILAAIVLLPALALAQTTIAVPQTIGYQGRLLKSDGTPETGTVTVTFAVYGQETGGTALWSEQQPVALSNGFYAVFLGSVTPFSNATTVPLFDGHDRWLELQVQGDTNPLSPRQKIASVAYALTATNASHAVSADSATNATNAANAANATNASHATNADNASHAASATSADSATFASQIADGTVSSSKIVGGAVGSAQIAAGAVGTSQIADGAVTSSKIAGGFTGSFSAGCVVVQVANGIVIGTDSSGCSGGG